MTKTEKLLNIDLKTVDRATLQQREDIKINPNTPKKERLMEYVKQIKNPYCYLDGKTVVKISFSDTDTTLEDCIANYLQGV